jgi:hypothetical protein
MHDGDVGSGWMIVMMLGMVLFWGLVVAGRSDEADVCLTSGARLSAAAVPTPVTAPRPVAG